MLTDEEALEVARTCKVVAVVGMTDGSKPGRPSFDIPRMLQERGITVLPVNPLIKEALGVPAVAHLADLTAVPDLVDIFRRPEAIPELTDELLALAPGRRPKTVWLQTGISHPESEARLEAAGYQVVSDKCLGVLVARSGR
ncbi:MAG TPA: CoA-binding protein [bacterium]|jgi:predicted CoA-binding protein|nr:CoA-binding protein [bacterium]